MPLFVFMTTCNNIRLTQGKRKKTLTYAHRRCLVKLFTFSFIWCVAINLAEYGDRLKQCINIMFNY